MKNAIYNICEKFRGYSSETEYFEVLQVQRNGNDEYIIIVKLVEVEPKEEAVDESNE